MSSSSAPTMLILGGSGFVSGALSRLALNQGYQVWTVTRGHHALPLGAIGVNADRRDQAAFQRVIAETGMTWDVVVDSIGYEVEDAVQDLAVFQKLAGHFLFISTDFVYDPYHRQYPQPEDTEFFWKEGYGWKKRLCELEFINNPQTSMPWTIVRPCYVYGPGSQLGTLPMHRRDPQLISRLRSGEHIRLVGGGHFLQHPIFVNDLAEVLLSLAGRQNAYGQIYNAGGPEIAEAAGYFKIVADILGVQLKIEELSVSAHLAAHPEDAPSCCNRIYDITKLAASGAAYPSTPLAVGLRQQVDSMLE